MCMLFFFSKLKALEAEKAEKEEMQENKRKIHQKTEVHAHDPRFK